MEIKKTCKWCGRSFIAQKRTTQYCGHSCASLAYKKRKRNEAKEIKELDQITEPARQIQDQEYLIFSKAAILLGTSRQYIYKLVHEGKLRASRLSTRISFVRKSDIELMLKSKPYQKNIPKEEVCISEYYTTEEIMKKYKVQKSWVYAMVRKNKVPKLSIRRINYYSKKHIDAAFSKYATDSDLSEWYTPEEIADKYKMTRNAIRSQVYRNNIPSKKEHGKIFYSKIHFDLSKSQGKEKDDFYYTVPQAMEKYNLTRDSVYGILRFHKLTKVKEGKHVKFVKAEFDKVMGANIDNNRK